MSGRRATPERRLAGRPRFEWLEPRRLPASLLVTTAADSGPGSLRAAIAAADADRTTPVVEIDFAIAAGGGFILPTSPLPTLTRPAFLDGTSQPGYSGTPLITIDGSREPAGTDGLTIAGGLSTVDGLEVAGFAPAAPATAGGQSTGGRGILLAGAGGDRVIRSRLYSDGIGAEVDAPDSTIGGPSGVGDVISGNQGTRAAAGRSTAGDGLLVDAVPGAVIQGDTIGTTADFSDTFGNTGDGIDVEGATGTSIGGAGTAEGNLVADSGGDGIHIDAQAAPGQDSDATIQGNTVGPFLTGFTPPPGGQIGVSGMSFSYGTNAGSGIAVLGGGNTIGGTTRAAGNVVSVNGYSGPFGEGTANQATAGISVEAIAADGSPRPGGGANLIQGNLVGTGGDGKGIIYSDLSFAGVLSIPIFNQGAGIRATGGGTIGGPALGAGNVVSRNQDGGIIADGFTIQGNRVGTDASGSVAEGNQGPGVELTGSDTLGGTSPGARNVIAGNGDGVVIRATASALPGSIAIQGNAIGTDLAADKLLGNAGFGIDVAADLPGQQVQGAAGSLLIGGSAPGAGNVIAGSGDAGIAVGDVGDLFADDGPSLFPGGVLIRGNAIGTDPTGTARLDGGVGAEVFSFTTPVTIGGTNPGEGNVIAYNFDPGVYQVGESFPVIGNAIFGNRGGQILPHESLIFPGPVLTAAIGQGGTVTIFGTFVTYPHYQQSFDFFASPPGLAGGAGGRTYLGTASATADIDGRGIIRITFPLPADLPGLGAQDFFTATATYPGNDTAPGSAPFFGATSYFSNGVTLAPPTVPFTDLALTGTVPSAALNPAAGATLTLTVTNAGTNTAHGVTINDASPHGGPLLSATTSRGVVTFTTDGGFRAEIGDLPAGASATVTFRTALAFVVGDYIAQATVAALTPDVEVANNSIIQVIDVSASVPAPAAADVALKGRATPSPASFGGDVTYTLTASTLADAADVAIFFVLPEGATLVSATSSRGPVTSNGSFLAAYLGPLAPAADATLTILIAAPGASTGETGLISRADVQSGNPDPDLENNFIDQVVPLKR